MSIFNFINSVRLGITDRGSYRISVEYWKPIAKKIGRNFKEEIFPHEIIQGNEQIAERIFDFNNVNAANLFVGYCVYPFVNQDLGLFQNKTASNEKYFFDADMNTNVKHDDAFIGIGHKDILQKQRKNMTKVFLKNIFAKSKVK